MGPHRQPSLFQHEPFFGRQQPQIRLLRVLSIIEGREIPVHCELTAWHFPEAPPYSAISYTWGDEAPLSTILLNGSRLDVRLNCEYVLKQTNEFANGRYVWLDAICIDQTNNREKSTQVAMMGDIYSQAVQVLACVGPADNSSVFLYSMLRKEEPQFRPLLTYTDSVEQNRPMLSSFGSMSFTQSAIWRIKRRRSTIYKLYHALYNFLARPYFDRLWIYQELSLGSNVRVFCGNENVLITWIYAMYLAIENWVESRAMYLLFLRHDWYRKMQEVEPILDAAVSKQTRMFSRIEAMEAVAPLLCQNPRDRVYGTLSMVDWGSDIVLRPEYTNDRIDLAIDVMYRSRSELGSMTDIVSLWECAEQIALNLDLIKSPSRKQAAYLKLRDSTTPLRRFSDSEFTPVQKLPISTHQSLSLGFSGVRLSFQDDVWSSVHLQGHKSQPRVAIWPGANEDRLECTKTDIILPPGAQSGDWLLIPISHSDGDVRYDHPRLLGTGIALLARETSFDPSIFKLVGKGRTKKPTTWPWNWRNRLTMRAPFFQVYLHHEDVLIWMQTCDWDVAFDQQYLSKPGQRKQVEQYFRINICHRFSSYAWIDDGDCPEWQDLRSDRGLIGTLGSWRAARKLLRK